MNKFEAVIEYINNSTTHFSVKMVKTHVNGRHELYESTINNYINQLNLSEYIKRINRGLYIKVKDIPTDLTSSKLKFLAYDEGCRIRRERKHKLDKLFNNG